MEELFFLGNASVTLITKNNLVCAAFPGAIVFGQIKDRSFISNKSFVFCRGSYHVIFLAFVEFAKVFSGKNAMTKKCFLRQDTISYHWEVTKLNEAFLVTLTIEKNSSEDFRVSFTQDELNSLCFAIKELVLPSLCLKFVESELLSNVALKTSVTQIRKFKFKDECIEFSKKYFKEETQHYEVGAIILHFYRDIIMFLHKLDQFYSEKPEDDIMKIMCTDV